MSLLPCCVVGLRAAPCHGQEFRAAPRCFHRSLPEGFAVPGAIPGSVWLPTRETRGISSPVLPGAQRWTGGAQYTACQEPRTCYKCLKAAPIEAPCLTCGRSGTDPSGAGAVGGDAPDPLPRPDPAPPEQSIPEAAAHPCGDPTGWRCPSGAGGRWWVPPGAAGRASPRHADMPRHACALCPRRQVHARGCSPGGVRRNGTARVHTHTHTHTHAPAGMQPRLSCPPRLA